MRRIRPTTILWGNRETDDPVEIDDYGDVTELGQWVGPKWAVVSLSAAQRTELAYLLVTGNPMPRDKS